MKFQGAREKILEPLQAVIGVVERKQTMPILANVLLKVSNGRLSVLATDLEVELSATVEIDAQEDGEITVPGRKLVDIVKALPDSSVVSIHQSGDKIQVKAGRSKFSLTTLPAADFPTVEQIAPTLSFEAPANQIKHLIDKTYFSMAHQDVRYYLNGLLFEADGKMLRTVATDGHRLALCEMELTTKAGLQQVIVPRKGILELQRLLGNDGSIGVDIGSNHIRITIGEIRFTSKLIDGRFPEYGRVIPENPGRTITADREMLRHALSRTSILANEKYRGIRALLKPNQIVLTAHNPEQEEAEEEVEVTYSGEEFEVGFNVNYLMDALSAIDGAEVQIGLTDSNSSCLLSAPGDKSTRYVVMPMRL
jgi:DNA polymerase-3 subunit beta